MKKSILKLAIAIGLVLGTDDVFSQVGVGIGTGGFGMGMRIPINGRNNSQRSNRLESQVQDMKHDLDLKDDQVVKVRGLLIERDRDHQRGNKMSNEDFDKRMQEILTPDQYSKYNELKQQKRQDRQQNKKDNKKDALPESDWDDVYR
jgi:protein CpxP